MDDVRALLSQETPSGSSPDSIIQALGDLLEKTMKHPTESNTFRRLRAFSGKIPTPPGEESFEHWLAQSQVMVEECSFSDRENCTRIIES